MGGKESLQKCVKSKSNLKASHHYSTTTDLVDLSALLGYQRKSLAGCCSGHCSEYWFFIMPTLRIVHAIVVPIMWGRDVRAVATLRMDGRWIKMIQMMMWESSVW